jgi:hydrogenase-1 operon protein HyaE
VSGIFDALLALPGAARVDAASVEAFVGDAPRCVLFLTGDTLQRPEAADVGVVLREVLKGLPAPHGIRVGIVARPDEGAVMKRYGVVVLPALVLLRDGQVVDIVARMRDWDVYARAFGKLTAPDAVPA